MLVPPPRAFECSFAAGVALLALVLWAPAASAACTPKTNLEAIVDDSNSMSLSDPGDLRIRAMELLIDTQGIGRFQVVRRGKVLTRRRLKVSARGGRTFTTVRVSGLLAGRVRFSVKPSRLADPGAPVSLTTQATRRLTR